MKFSIQDFFSKCNQIRIRSHLLKKFLMENFIFYAVETANLVTFTDEILKGKLHFLFSDLHCYNILKYITHREL